jgi:hypothetical protein
MIDDMGARRAILATSSPSSHALPIRKFKSGSRANTVSCLRARSFCTACKEQFGLKPELPDEPRADPGETGASRSEACVVSERYYRTPVDRSGQSNILTQGPAPARFLTQGNVPVRSPLGFEMGRGAPVRLTYNMRQAPACWLPS